MLDWTGVERVLLMLAVLMPILMKLFPIPSVRAMCGAWRNGRSRRSIKVLVRRSKYEERQRKSIRFKTPLSLREKKLVSREKRKRIQAEQEKKLADAMTQLQTAIKYSW